MGIFLAAVWLGFGLYMAATEIRGAIRDFMHIKIDYTKRTWVEYQSDKEGK